MNIEQVWGWGAALVALLWANREVVWRIVAEAMREAEKAGKDRPDLGPLELNMWLEDLAVNAVRRCRWLRWLPERLLRGIIREICIRQKLRRLDEEEDPQE